MKHHDNERNDIGKEHPANHPGQIIGALLFFCVNVVDVYVFKLTVIPVDILYVQIPLAVAVIAFAAYMISSGLKTVFEERRDPPEVIRKGVFSWIRHPVYAGAMLIMFGFFILGFSIASLIVIGMNFVFYNWMASYEEEILKDMFGDEYLKYMKEVGRWFPKFYRGRK